MYRIRSAPFLLTRLCSMSDRPPHPYSWRPMPLYGPPIPVYMPPVPLYAPPTPHHMTSSEYYRAPWYPASVDGVWQHWTGQMESSRNYGSYRNRDNDYYYHRRRSRHASSNRRHYSRHDHHDKRSRSPYNSETDYHSHYSPGSYSSPGPRSRSSPEPRSRSSPDPRARAPQRPLVVVNEPYKDLVKCYPSLTVMTYNVLASSLIQSNKYLYRKDGTEVLEWDYRKGRLLQEMIDSGADVRNSDCQ